MMVRSTLFVTLAAGLAASVHSTPAKAQDGRLDRAYKLCQYDFAVSCAAGSPKGSECFTLAACDKVRRLWYSLLSEGWKDDPQIEDDRAFIEDVAKSHQP